MKQESFSIEIPVNDEEDMDEFQKVMDDYYDEMNQLIEEDMDEFRKVMDDYYDEMNQLIEEEANKLGISFFDMADIWYLRSRSRWTQEKEDYLIKLAKEGKELPNVLVGDF